MTLFKFNDKLQFCFENKLDTVPAPWTDAATIQELSFWGPDYRIKNT